MKIYIFYIDQMVNGQHLAQGAVPHLTKESALIRFKEFVEDEKQYVKRDKWVITRDINDWFMASKKGDYASNHVEACILAEELQDLNSSNIIASYTVGVAENNPFYGKIKNENIIINRFEHTEYKNLICPYGEKVIFRIKHPYSGVLHTFEIAMELFTLESTGDKSDYGSTSIDVEGDLFEFTVYADEKHSIYHAECHVCSGDDDDVLVKLCLNDEIDGYTVVI